MRLRIVPVYTVLLPGLPVLVDHIVVRKMKLQLARALILTALLLTGACKSISKSTESQTSTVTPSRHVTTQCQAFEIAKSALPSKLASNLSGALCDIDLARGTHGTWFVEIMVDKITREELGWQNGGNVEFGPGNSYNLLEIDVDALTGGVTLKKATNGLLLGGPSQWVYCDSSMQNQRVIEITSVVGPLPPFNPGGPIVEITLKNVSPEPIISLNVTLRLSTLTGFNFLVTSSVPWLPNKSISLEQPIIGGGFSDSLLYPLEITGTFQNGSVFLYVEQVQITSPSSR